MQTVGRVSHLHLFLIVTAGRELESGTAHCCLGGWPEKREERSGGMRSFKSMETTTGAGSVGRGHSGNFYLHLHLGTSRQAVPAALMDGGITVWKERERERKAR